MGLFKLFFGHARVRRHLPDDIIVDILSRLPAKQVLKNRTVCKRWLALTCAPYFIELHLQRTVTTAPSVLLFQSIHLPVAQYILIPKNKLDMYIYDHKTIRKTQRNLVKVRLSEKLKLAGSCNGLLVFRPVSSNSRFEVCNIFTREQVTVEAPAGTQLDHFDARRSAIHALFQHPVNKEHMILFSHAPPQSPVDFWTYSFASKSWRKASTFTHAPRRDTNPVVLNETLHWLTAGDLDISYPRCESSIIMYDMVRETHRIMPHPGNRLSSEEFCAGRCISESRGSIILCYIVSNKLINVWVLEDYDNWIWGKKHSIITDDRHIIMSTGKEVLLINLYDGWLRQVHLEQENNNNVSIRNVTRVKSRLLRALWPKLGTIFNSVYYAKSLVSLEV